MPLASAPLLSSRCITPAEPWWVGGLGLRWARGAGVVPGGRAVSARAQGAEKGPDAAGIRPSLVFALHNSGGTLVGGGFGPRRARGAGVVPGGRAVSARAPGASRGRMPPASVPLLSSRCITPAKPRPVRRLGTRRARSAGVVPGGHGRAATCGFCSPTGREEGTGCHGIRPFSFSRRITPAEPRPVRRPGPRRHRMQGLRRGDARLPPAHRIRRRGRMPLASGPCLRVDQ
jgi:hypothetical protein